MSVSFPGQLASLVARVFRARDTFSRTGVSLPKRTLIALSSGFVIVAAAAAVLGPSLRESFAMDDDFHGEYRRMLAAERGQTRAAASRPTFFFPVRAQPMAYAPAPKPIAFGPFHTRDNTRSTPRASSNLSIFPQASPLASSLPRRSVCVRLCDGFFFPVGDYNGPADDAAHGATCAGLCPGAPTRLFVTPSGSDSIADAVSARDHKPYRTLPVALRYASKRDSSCSCGGPGQAGLGSVPVLRDFTLRRGDKVMTQSGFQVFRGGASLPYSPRDFVSLANSRDISNADRRALGAIERASYSTRGAPATSRPVAAGKPAATPARAPAMSDSSGKSIRLIGPQAMLRSPAEAAGQ